MSSSTPASNDITVIQAHGKRLAKAIRADASLPIGDRVIGYDSVKTVTLYSLALGGLDDIKEIMSELLERRDCAVVRGAIADPARTVRVRRLLHKDHETGDLPTLIDVPRRWLAIDADSLLLPENLRAADLTGCASIVVQRLPYAFHGVRCIVAASGGHAVKPGIRLRLWYWLSRSTTGTELKRWLADAPVDHAVFSAAQLIYTAAPWFEPPGCDPLPSRLSELFGTPEVLVPSAAALTPPPRPEPAPIRLSDVATFAEARARQRVTDMISRALYRVRSAGEGERHPTLRAAATTIGGLIEAAGITEATAARHLRDAVEAAGAHDLENAEKTIAWGLKRGAESPLVTRGEG